MSTLDDLNERFVRLQFGSGQRTRLYEKLIDLLHNNIKLTEALDICWQHASYDGRKPKRVAAIALDTSGPGCGTASSSATPCRAGSRIPTAW